MRKKTRMVLMAACFLSLSCAKKPLPELPAAMIPEPLPADVESVIFVVGDMGAALWDRSPMPRRIARDVEWWSRALGRDSSVAVLFLGDNIYPGGMHDQEDPMWAADSMHLETQAQILAGPDARRNKSFGVFIAGNHDWGNKPGGPGERRIKNQEVFLARRRAGGTLVSLQPPNATPGPGILDVGNNFRMLLIDTAWWLLAADQAEKERMMDRMRAQLSQSHNRNVMIAAHHPLRSASSHGGAVAFWEAFGVRWLLYKSGAALQDLNSLPYRDFRDRLNKIFETEGAPLLFAGGHDHALQVMRGTSEHEPAYMVVSGAGSKSSKVGHTEGMLYRSEEPGFMKLVVRKNGGVDLFVYTAPSAYLYCDTGTPDVQRQCVESGAAEFTIKFGAKLK
jgi:hypothetical protein